MRISELRRKDEIIVHRDNSDDIRLPNDATRIKRFLQAVVTVNETAPGVVDDDLDVGELRSELKYSEKVPDF